jgi:Mrp family chromosome partitioning ATPase
MVAKAGETNRKTVGSALNTLQRVRANVVGIVLNSVTSNMSDSYRYYGYYGKYYRYYKTAESD